ncbi:MAG: TrpB-like pyridoxal phosphate-dependent enzyme [Clostridia bacterium]|nr:TrpB-like pyridoxal phosphate-dependent enzyme [Clostridia bacterium]
MNSDRLKVVLDEREIPKQWYNIQADMPNPPPPHISSQTFKTATLEDMTALFPKEALMQEYSRERYIDIPAPVIEEYKKYRCTPLIRAKSFEKALGTNCKIFYKYEGGNATGSHKLNTALPQAFYNKNEGIKRITTETGAGQWGTAIAMACSLYGMECVVYMVRVSYQQKPYRKIFMETFGADVYASPSDNTVIGRNYLKENPNHSGSLGIAISEAVEDAVQREDSHYSLGSVLNHVCLHQTVIGLEAKKQFDVFGEYPDIVIGCHGGGSNFSGIANPFLEDKIRFGKKTRVIAVESAACPTLTKGIYSYDYGDSAKIGPIALMYTLGHDYIPSGIHAGGLRYHGASPLVSSLLNDKLIEAQAYSQQEILEMGLTFGKSEGIIPAPESSHAIMSAAYEAKKADEEGVRKTILFNLSGHGYLDLYAYEKLLSKTLENSDFDAKDMDSALKKLPKINA